MGNLLKVLGNKEDGASKIDFFVDFENCKPTEAELPVWETVAAVLEKAPSIIQELRNYNGASNEIREAISNANDENLQSKAWTAVLPLVQQLKRYYEFSIELSEGVVPNLLKVLCSNDLTSKEHLESQQALFKQFAEISNFTLEFDELKMTQPSIQNDFSYYRRMVGRRNNMEENANVQTVSTEMANKMSLFYAFPTPMLKMLSDSTTRFVSENKDLPVENTTDCLATMANICRAMIENPNKFQREETLMFCLRVMVGVTILYDHVHPVGAFSKTSNIDVRASIKLLKDQKEGTVDGLLNALRYTTKHLNDDTTPKSVRLSLN